MIDEIVVIYTINDLFKAIAHSEDYRRIISDVEVIASALTASLLFL